jgi:hypothetical protein
VAEGFELADVAAFAVPGADAGGVEPWSGSHKLAPGVGQQVPDLSHRIAQETTLRGWRDRPSTSSPATTPIIPAKRPSREPRFHRVRNAQAIVSTALNSQ